MRPRPWTREELKELVVLYPTTDIEVLMEKFGRSYRGIICKASALQAKKDIALRAAMGKRAHLIAIGPRKPRKFWTSSVVKQILEAYPYTSNHELAVRYGTSRRSIACLANLRGVKKAKTYISAVNRRPSNRIGRATGATESGAGGTD